MILLVLILAGVTAAGSAGACGPSVLLPAYAHNDYRNRRPLLDAIELGYRGVEADVFRVGSALLVGHGRGELRPARTLAHLYLEPLRRRRQECGYVLPDSTSLFLNIEIKDPDSVAFRLLLSELFAYEELFHAPSPLSRPPVQVTLVGWWPNTGDASSWPPYLRVHASLGRNASRGDPPLRSRIGLVSLDYGKVIKWSGQGSVPREAGALLARAREQAASYGAPIRVHHAPEQRRVYAWLLSEGVMLIGADNLRRARSLLEGI